MQAMRAMSLEACKNVEIDRHEGHLTLRNLTPLASTFLTTVDALDHWSRETPDATFVAERDDQVWIALSYRSAAERVRSIAGRLLALGCSPEKPLAIVSENSIEHALLTLAAMSVGVPVAPISTAYATIATDFARLRYMLELIGPAAIWFGQPARCPQAIDAVCDLAQAVVSGAQNGPRSIALESVPNVAESEYQVARASISGDTIAKLMFTSGSTGKPKAVVNTQSMLCSNQAMLKMIWPTICNAAPILVDWLPWTHTFGANFTFNLSLFNGGALYIDGGKPMPQAIGLTLQNLSDVQPTVYFNVPAGYDALLVKLRADHDLAKRVFARMQFAFFAAAALPQSTRQEFQTLFRDITGRELPFFTGWGSTETAPCATATWWDTPRSDNIGLPLPGVELRMVPDEDKLELRVRGPNVTPGYWRMPGADIEAFDQDGFYRMGDAGRLIDQVDPLAGVVFDGRISENFKLTSGTWVNVGAVRISLVDAGRPIIRDVVVTGSGRADVGALVFVDQAACRNLIGPSAKSLSDAEVAMHPAVQAAVDGSIQVYNGGSRGSSSRVARFVILPDHPRIEAFEITDKGYINQRSVLAARSAAVDELYNGSWS